MIKRYICALIFNYCYLMNRERLRLFLIPFSGGNAYSYSGFRKYLPDNIVFHNLELPGRGKRISEPLLVRTEQMTEDLFAQIEGFTDDRYAIFGHSLGALLGYTLCRLLAERKMKLPVRLFSSGQTAPALISSDNKHELPNDMLVKVLREMNGTPDELLNDGDFLDYFLPVIRADFRSVAEFRYRSQPVPLNIPVDILLGSEEDTTDEDALAWRDETNGDVSVHRFSGGHFFIYDHIPEICRLMISRMQQR